MNKLTISMKGDASRRTTVKLNGVEVQNLLGVELRLNVEEAPLAVLTVRVDQVEVEGEAEIDVEFDDPNPPDAPVDIMDAVRAVAKH